MKNKNDANTLPSSLNLSHSPLSVKAPFQWLLAASLSLALLSCQSPTGLNANPNPSSAALQARHRQADASLSHLRKASVVSALAQVRSQNDGQYDQIQLQIRLPKFMRTQMASDEIAFIRVSVQGQAMSQINGSLVAATSDTLTATLTNIPRSGGKLRVVTVQAYDASQTLLPAFSAKGYYTSSSDTTVDLSVNRQYYLLGAILEKLFVDRSTVASLIDLTSLQTTLEDMFDFNANNSSFGTDPMMYDAALLADQIASDGSFPDASTLSTAALGTSANPVITIHTDDALPTGEELFIVVNDPRSKPVKIARLSNSGDSHTISNVTPGTWTLNVQNTSGNVLASTSVVAERNGTATLGNTELTVSGIDTAPGEFQVNTYTTDNQSRSAIAHDQDGNFVLVWQSGSQDGNDTGIFAQRFDSQGQATGTEFQVNTSTSLAQTDADVAMDADGDFVIVWQQTESGDNQSTIRGQRFDSQGVAQNTEFLVGSYQVNSYTNDKQESPAIACDELGNFVISWHIHNRDLSSSGVYAQRFDSQGQALVSEFLVNSITTAEQSNPDIAMDADGDFVITWQSAYQDGSDRGIYAQRYDRTGARQEDEFAVNTYTVGTQSDAQVAMLNNGSFLIAWASNEQDGSLTGVYAQSFDSSGSPVGAEFRVNTYTSDYQDAIDLATDAESHYIVSWQSNGQDGSSNGIYAQRLNQNGLTLNQEFLVNTSTNNNQTNPCVMMTLEGSFVIAWTSENGQDGQGEGIFAQRYNDQGQSL